MVTSGPHIALSTEDLPQIGRVSGAVDVSHRPLSEQSFGGKGDAEQRRIPVSWIRDDPQVAVEDLVRATLQKLQIVIPAGAEHAGDAITRVFGAGVRQDRLQRFLINWHGCRADIHQTHETG